MPRINKIMSGEQDITEEVLGIIAVTGITPDIVDRFSSLLIMQIYTSYVTRTEDPFNICHEILCLEEGPSNCSSNTKPQAMFNRKPFLRGLWHKHYRGVGIPTFAQNLRMSLHTYGIPYLDELLEKSERTGETHYLTEEDAKKISHQVVMEHYMRRSAEKKMTGHWIIYAIHEGKNYYLCLGQHTDDEAHLRTQIDMVCKADFQFLESILEKLPE